MVVPIFAAVLERVSVALRDEVIIAPKPAAPTNPTIAVLALNTAPATACKPLVAELKPFLVLSNALIVIFTSSAIVFTHYLEIGKPFVEMTNRHLLCFFYAHVKAIGQR